MKRLRFLPVWIAFALAAAAPSFAFAKEDVAAKLRAASEEAKRNAGVYYDEIFDAGGKLRPQYRDVYPRHLERSKTNLQQFRIQSKKDFAGDNALGSVARIFTKEEGEFLQRGTAQRGQALLAFLKDYYSGGKDYTKVIPEAVVKRIAERNGEAGFLGQLNPNTISFMYGPDIIRDKDGVFRVLEDNTNFLGMQGDLLKSHEILARRAPEYAAPMAAERFEDPHQIYRNLMERYRSQLKNPNERVIFFSIPPFPDKEDARLIKIWGDLGAVPVTPYTRTPKLVRRKDGTYLDWGAEAKKRYEKVGFVIYNSEFYGADHTNRAAHAQMLMHEAKEWISSKNLAPTHRAALEKAMKPDATTGRVNYELLEDTLANKLNVSVKSLSRLPGFVTDIATGKLPSNNTPGIDFVNDKEFNIYVEDLIRHYLKEEPVLRNIETHRVYRTGADGKLQLNDEVLAKLEKGWDEFVVKVVDGRGGDGVWVGPKLSAKERAEVVAFLRRQRDRDVILQKFTHPSVHNGDILDIRTYGQIGLGDPLVSKGGATRAVTKHGDGKVNLSGGKAHELAVMVERESRGPAEARLKRLMEAPCAGRFSELRP